MRHKLLAGALLACLAAPGCRAPDAARQLMAETITGHRQPIAHAGARLLPPEPAIYPLSPCGRGVGGKGSTQKATGRKRYPFGFLC